MAAKAEDEWWSELATDLWKEGQLKHLRDAALPYLYEQQFAYDPSTGLYGFQTYGTEADQEEEEFTFIHTEEPSDAVTTIAATASDIHQQFKPVHEEHPQLQSSKFNTYSFYAPNNNYTIDTASVCVQSVP